MKRIIYFAILLALLCSCDDANKEITFTNEEKMVVYCFPTAGDSTLIRITRSQPVSRYSDSTTLTSIHDAHITYMINGRPAEIKNNGDGTYIAIGHQDYHDIINFQAQAENINPVTAETYIPEPVPFTQVKCRTQTTQDGYTFKRETIFEPSFQDNGSQKNFYAVMILKRTYKRTALCFKKGNDGKEYSYTYDEVERLEKGVDYDSMTYIIADSSLYYQKIDPMQEPVLGTPSPMDEVFESKNDFYNDFYIFNDNKFNGKEYTLNLVLDDNYEHVPPIGYVELYSLTPEYYKFIYSINTTENNQWLEMGLSNVFPIFTNVKGGLGAFAGWAKTVSKGHVIKYNK